MDIAALSRPAINLSRSLLMAFAMTLSLLYLMHILIVTEDIELAPPIHKIANIIQMPKTIETQPEFSKPDPIEEAEPEPLRPDMPMDLEQRDGDFSHSEITYRPGNVLEGGGISLGGGGVVQQVMIPPTYPSRALAKGQEGFVDVQFDVTAAGKTDNVIVLRSEPEGYFESAAVRAIKRWKYLPDEERAGEPVTLQERISFRLEQ